MLSHWRAEVKGHGDTTALANPVALHGLDLFRPLIQFIEIFQQLFGIVGDTDKPLGNFLALHRGAGAPAAAVDHLFIGQYGLIYRVPVDGGHLFIHQPLFIEFGKEPLFPLIVVRLAGGQLSRPVDAKAEGFQLGLHVGDIFMGPFCGSGFVLDRRIFCRQAKGVPAHWMQYVLALHTLVASDNIGNGVVAHMTHMQLAAGIGEHGQAVKLFPLDLQ